MAEIVVGEAPESDDETLAAAVSGEASETDEDLLEIFENTPNVTILNKTEHFSRNSLLQRKLIENNIKIYKSVVYYITFFALPVSKHLLNADQLLIKSQIFMQGVLSSLKSSQLQSLNLYQKTEDVFSTNFLSNISLKNHK